MSSAWRRGAGYAPSGVFRVAPGAVELLAELLGRMGGCRKGGHREARIVLASAAVRSRQRFCHGDQPVPAGPARSRVPPVGAEPPRRVADGRGPGPARRMMWVCGQRSRLRSASRARAFFTPAAPTSTAERSRAGTAFLRRTPEAAYSSTPGRSRGTTPPPAPRAAECPVLSSSSTDSGDARRLSGKRSTSS